MEETGLARIYGIRPHGVARGGGVSSLSGLNLQYHDKIGLK